MSKKTPGSDGRFYDVTPDGAKQSGGDAAAKPPAHKKVDVTKVPDDGASATRIKPDDGASATRIKPDDGASATRIKPDDGASTTRIKP